MMARNIPSRSIIPGAVKISSTMSVEKERKGQAEAILLKYAAYMRQLPGKAGYRK